MPSKMTPYKRKIMKEDLRDAGESTTGHVIPLIVKSRYLPMKIFLFVVWLTGVALTIVLITYSIIDFFKYEVTTKTRYMRESPMLFPKVTICNNDPFPTLAAVTFLANLFRTDAVFTNNLAKADAEGVDTNDDINLVNWFITKENDDEIEFLSKAMTKALQSDETTKRSLGYDQGTFIQDCVFDEKNCSDKFTHSYDIGFGNCFTFNADKTFSSKKSGKSRGLNLILKVGKNATYETIGDLQSATVFIYNHTSFYTEADRIEVPGSFHTNIIMKKKISEIAESPYSECVIKDNVKLAVTASTDTELIDLFIKSQYKYNYANCFDVCYQSLLKENCGCIDGFVPFLNLKKIDIQTIKFCNYNDDEVDECYSKFAESLDETCGKKCPFECDIASTTTTLTYESSLADSTEYLTLSIYYLELSYEFSTEGPAITSVALLSGIGGTLGLFLGFSVLSPCEGVDMLVNFLMVYFGKDKEDESDNVDEFTN